MNPFVILAMGAFVVAILALLVLTASGLAYLAFQLVPKLQDSALAVTGTDIVNSVRSMPTYPTWLYRCRKIESPKSILVIFALDAMVKTEYLTGFDRLHRLVFEPERDKALVLDYECNNEAIKKVYQLSVDRALNVCLMFAGKQPRGFKPKDDEGRRGLARLMCSPPQDDSSDAFHPATICSPGAPLGKQITSVQRLFNTLHENRKEELGWKKITQLRRKRKVQTRHPSKQFEQACAKSPIASGGCGARP
jgi:hypothetical protein